MKKIINLVSSLLPYDAVGDYTCKINDIFIQNNFDSNIFTSNLKKNYKYAKKIDSLDANLNCDIITYQFATCDNVLFDLFIKSKAKNKIIFFHNITPSYFFSKYDKNIENIQKAAINQLKKLSKITNFTVSMSKFSMQNLSDLGFKNNFVIPFFVDLEKKIQQKKEKKNYQILFLGRISPNKCQLDILKTFYFIKKYFINNIDLVFIGRNDVPSYFSVLENFITKYNLKNVSFESNLNKNRLNNYIQNTDLFFSMSEHEGFFVPIYEFISMQIPILAYDIPVLWENNLSDCIYTFNNKNYYKIANFIYEFLKDKNMQTENKLNQIKWFKNYINDIKYNQQKLINIINQYAI